MYLIYKDSALISFDRHKKGKNLSDFLVSDIWQLVGSKSITTGATRTMPSEWKLFYAIEFLCNETNTVFQLESKLLQGCL